MNLCDKIMDGVGAYTNYIGTVALALVMLIITANVFYRLRLIYLFEGMGRNSLVVEFIW
jgi:hypothetical protein